jgi:membrane protease YdiL (CAAX protease family)
MLVLAVELVWLCRHLQLRQKRDYGYGLPWRRFVRVCALWAVIGIATAGVGAAFLLSTGLRIQDPQFVLSASSLARIVAVGAASGVGVALIEETVFRGAMHTAIEREAGAWTAALCTAPLFAVLHFFAKARIPADQVGWGSGFELLRLSFAPLVHPALVFDSFLSWCLIGLILSMTRALTGNIAVAIGLHAGWVVVLRMLQQSTLGGDSPRYAAWVGRFDGLLGYWLLPWGVAIAGALWLTRESWVIYARSMSRSSR